MGSSCWAREEPAGSRATKHMGSSKHGAPARQAPQDRQPGPESAPAPQQCQALPCSMLPLSSSQMLSVTRAPSPHGTLPFVLPTFTPGSPPQELSQAPATPQVPWAALPFLSFCFAMAMRAVATMMPPNWQPRAALHCPTCSCSQHSAAPHCPTCSCSQPCAVLHCPTCSCSQHQVDAGHGMAP